MKRPFEGGFEVTLGISMATYHHVVYPLALLTRHMYTQGNFELHCMGMCSILNTL